VEEQLAFASLVLLNKSDCVDGGALVRLSKAIREVNKTVEVLPCTYCDVDVSYILSSSSTGGQTLEQRGRRQPVGAWSPDRVLFEIESIKLSISGGGPTGDTTQLPTYAPAASPEHDAVRCISVRIDGELDLDAFNRWVLRTLKDFNILRAKGVLAAKGHDRKLAFQAVHAAFHGTPSLKARWLPGEPRFSQVVVIGCDIQPELIEFGLRRCLAE